MLYFCWIAAIIALIFLYRWLVRGRVINLWVALGVLVDVGKDPACQLLIDLQKFWKWIRRGFRRENRIGEEPDVEEYEHFYRD